MRRSSVVPAMRTRPRPPAASHLLALLAWCLFALMSPASRAAEGTAADAPAVRTGGPAGTRASSIGRVVIASGLVEADGAGGATRVLQKGDPVFEGDVLRTDPGGRTQITFNDGARLAVRPATKLAIEAYHDADPTRTQQIAFRLERGGFRTATGRIGRANRSAYRFSTPQAVIGIRGTDWGAQLVEDQEGDETPTLQIGVVEGGVNVTNDAGSLDLGEDADFNFATVEDFSTPPMGSNEPPPGLSGVLEVQYDLSEIESDAAEAPAEGGDAAAEEESDGKDGEKAESDSAVASGEEGEEETGGDCCSDQGEAVEIGGDAGGAATDDGDVMFEYGDRCF